jgi:hypothetical protein
VTRYEITCAKPGIIIDGHGMIQCAVATAKEGKLIVYVKDVNNEKFEKLLDAHPRVVSYFSNPATAPNPNTI